MSTVDCNRFNKNLITIWTSRYVLHCSFLGLVLLKVFKIKELKLLFLRLGFLILGLRFNLSTILCCHLRLRLFLDLLLFLNYRWLFTPVREYWYLAFIFNLLISKVQKLLYYVLPYLLNFVDHVKIETDKVITVALLRIIPRRMKGDEISGIYLDLFILCFYYLIIFFKSLILNQDTKFCLCLG